MVLMTENSKKYVQATVIPSICFLCLIVKNQKVFSFTTMNTPKRRNAGL